VCGAAVIIASGAGDQKVKNCTASCPNKWNLACAFANRCWSNIGSFVGLFVGLAAGIGLMVLAAKFGWITSLLQMCGAGASGLCGSCGGGSSSNAKDGKKEKQQQQSKRTSAASRRDSRSGKKKRRKGRNHGGSRSSIDSTDSRSSSLGSYEEDQRSPKAAAKDSKSGKGKGGSTSRRPSAAAAATAAAAAAAAAGGRERSWQTSGLTSPTSNSPAGMYAEFKESRQPWGSGAGDNEGYGGSGRPQRPYSSSGGVKKVSSRMQPQPWDDSATGGFSRQARPSSAAAAIGGKPLKRQSSGVEAGGSSCGGRVSRQVRSSSLEHAYAGQEGYEGRGPREFASAYGSSQQPVKQGFERPPARQPSRGEI
jgi:hypothetical protein